MDQSFNFLPIPTDVHFGHGMVKTLPARIKAMGATKPFLVTDSGVRAAGIIDQVLGVLEAAGINCVVYDGVKPDSGSGLISEAVQELKDSGADVVVGIGGGSSLDTAKAVAALVTNPGSIFEYVGLNKLKNKPIPVVAIPTASGTGSEVSFWSVFTDDTSRLKAAIGSVLLYPDVALCDPALTSELPPPLTAATGMDALAHAIECYTNNACNPISGSLALRAIELVGRHLRSAALNGREPHARYGMMLASTMAGMAMNATRLGLAHALAMPLGSWDLHIPHGVALAVTLPIVMEFNHLAEVERFADVARALGEKVDGLSVREAASKSYVAVRNLAMDIGIPGGLSQHGLTEEHIPAVAAEAIKSGNVAVNPRCADADDLARILRNAL